ncbi:hypothetical protein ACF05T_31865 [Streptomyces lateritius]|uniref:Uncharacterized protein n=1 Tax=Streptomyces lateritius TaxID=67313 RepID=A0ABW6YL65_9ACTN
MTHQWIIVSGSVNTFAIDPPAIAASLPRPPLGTVAVEAMPWELQVGDVVPYDDCIGRPIADIHAVGPGHRARRLILTDVPPLTVRHKLRVYRAVQRL